MLTRKPCKYCGSLWHSKAKCPQKPLHAFKDAQRPVTQLSPQKPSEGLTLRYKGKSTRSQLIGLADKYHSAYIRAKGSDGVWNWCYTCSARVPLDEIQNGHFMNRWRMVTRWLDINCHPQCNECNVVKGGNLEAYERRLRADYGNEAIDNLKQLARTSNKVTLAEIQEVIDKYVT